MTSENTMRVASYSEPAQGKRNEDRVVETTQAILVMDGTFGRGNEESLVVTAAAAEAWGERPEWHVRPTEGLLALSRHVQRRQRPSAFPAPGAAACAVGWSAAGDVDVAILGDVAAFALDGATSGVLVPPKRTEDGLLGDYLGLDTVGAESIRSTSARLSAKQSCIVVATDGVWEHVPLSRMADAWRHVGYDVDALSRELVRLARVFGSEDDATAVVVGQR